MFYSSRPDLIYCQRRPLKPPFSCFIVTVAIDLVCAPVIPTLFCVPLYNQPFIRVSCCVLRLVAWVNIFQTFEVSQLCYHQKLIFRLLFIGDICDLWLEALWRIEAIYLIFNLNCVSKTLAYNSWEKLTFKSRHFTVCKEKSN